MIKTNLGGKNMLFDEKKLSDEKKSKIALGTLKYIVIQESFKINVPLYENEIFKKWFTDFYKLDGGAFCTPAMRDIFYRVFQSLKSLNAIYWVNQNNLNELFVYITTILSEIAGDKEKSFPSKILHTLYYDSPIIDSNVIGGLDLKGDAVDVYNNLSNRYFNDKSIYIKNEAQPYSPKDGTGLLALADEDGWYDRFNEICKNCINKSLEQKDKRVVEIFKEICKAVRFKQTKNKIQQLEMELEIEKLFSEIRKENLLREINTKLGVDIFDLIENISKVKKIDFYLWALFA